MAIQAELPGVKREDVDDVRPEVELLADDPAVFRNAAGEEESGMIAVGFRGVGTVSHTLLGSVSIILICPPLGG